MLWLALLRTLMATTARVTTMRTIQRITTIIISTTPPRSQRQRGSEQRSSLRRTDPDLECASTSDSKQTRRGSKRLIGITCNFENRKTIEERRLKEFSLIFFLNRRRFRELSSEVGLELENLVFLRDETLYFVMTPKISSLVERGVLRSGKGKPCDLLQGENIDQHELEKVGEEIAAFCGVPPTSEYLRIRGRKDIQMFDFSTKTVCNRQMMLVAPSPYGKQGKKGEEEEVEERELFVGVCGDALLEPFWPLGTGANRAFLSGMDVGWLAGLFCQGQREELEPVARRLMVRLMESGEDTMRKDWAKYSLDPKTRYIG